MEEINILLIGNNRYFNNNIINELFTNSNIYNAPDIMSGAKIIDLHTPWVVLLFINNIKQNELNYLKELQLSNNTKHIQFLFFAESIEAVKEITSLINNCGTDHVLIPANNSEIELRVHSAFCRSKEILGNIINENKLYYERNFYMQLVESANESIYIVGQTGIPEYVNSNCTKLTGYTEEELLRTPIIDLVHPEDKEFVMKKIAGRISGDTNAYTYHVRLIHKTGYIKWVTQSSVGIQWKGKVGALLFAADITHLKEAELLLQQNEEKYRTVVEYAIEGIYVIQNGYIVFANKAVYDLTGYKPEELIGNSIINYLHDDDKGVILENYKRRLEGEIIPRYHLRIKKKNGDYIIVEINATQFEYNGMPATLNFSTDITERINVEKQLEEQNRELTKLNNTKNKLFSIIAHDLRSPFGSLISFIDIIKNRVLDEDYTELPHLLDYMNQAATSGFNLLENLLEWSRLQTKAIEFKPEYINLKSTVDNIINLYSNKAIEKNIDLFSKIKEEQFIYADENMISTVLRNLINNAIKFTPMNGVVFINYYENEKYSNITVTDTGVGINKQTLEKLFSITENISTAGTDKEKGTGIGLIICNEFVAAHNGNIYIESEVNKGSTFTISLPFNPLYH